MKKYLRITSSAALTAVVAVGLGLLAGGAQAAEMNPKSKLSMGDKKFVAKAYQGGMAEVASAKLAEEKAQNPATKKIAARLIADHSKANEKLRDIAKEENLNLDKTAMAKPASMSSDNFDKEYLTMQKQVHEKDIAMFEKEAADTKPNEDRDVPAFAKKTLPTLKKHLAMIEAALAKMK